MLNIGKIHSLIGQNPCNLQLNNHISCEKLDQEGAIAQIFSSLLGLAEFNTLQVVPTCIASENTGKKKGSQIICNIKKRDKHKRCLLTRGEGSAMETQDTREPYAEMCNTQGKLWCQRPACQHCLQNIIPTYGDLPLLFFVLRHRGSCVPPWLVS